MKYSDTLIDSEQDHSVSKFFSVHESVNSWTQNDSKSADFFIVISNLIESVLFVKLRIQGVQDRSIRSTILFSTSIKMIPWLETKSHNLKSIFCLSNFSTSSYPFWSWHWMIREFFSVCRFLIYWIPRIEKTCRHTCRFTCVEMFNYSVTIVFLIRHDLRE